MGKAAHEKHPMPPGFTGFDGDVDFMTTGLNGHIGVNINTDPQECDQRIRRNQRNPFVYDAEDGDNDLY